MSRLLLNTIALEPNRWMSERCAHFKLMDLLEPIAGAGFRSVEVWQYHLSRETEGAVNSLREAADSVGVQFPVVGCYPVLHHTGEDRLRAEAEAVRVFRYASLLGAKAVKIFAGSLPSADVSPDGYERSIDALQRLAAIGAEHGLAITGETHENTLLDNVDMCLRVLSDLGPSEMGLCYQPYDFADTARSITEYRVLALHVTHLHFQGRIGSEMGLLENADVDYDAFIADLAANGFDGYVCIEFVRDCVVASPAQFDLPLVLANAERDATYLRRIFSKHGMQLGD
jgi:sugar phosphate isomerase/epimerase